MYQAFRIKIHNSCCVNIFTEVVDGHNLGFGDDEALVHKLLWWVSWGSPMWEMCNINTTKIKNPTMPQQQYRTNSTRLEQPGWSGMMGNLRGFLMQIWSSATDIITESFSRCLLEKVEEGLLISNNQPLLFLPFSLPSMSSGWSKENGFTGILIFFNAKKPCSVKMLFTRFSSAMGTLYLIERDTRESEGWISLWIVGPWGLLLPGLPCSSVFL